MRVEIDVILFFPNDPMKKINGFLNVSADADEDDILEEMAEFINNVTEDYMEKFSTGMANLLVGDDEYYQVSFANPNNIGDEGRDICNMIIPDNLTVH